MQLPKRRLLAGLVAAATVALALLRITAGSSGMIESPLAIGDTPAHVFRPTGPARGPVVVIAHGFAGSSRLMDSLALSLARAGYVAISFDFPGHGANARPLTGSITDVNGATRTLLGALDTVVRRARTLGDGRVALLGHSMASDIVVRYAQENSGIDATIAVSMFAPTVTSMTPRNLLVIVGDWEGPLKREALRAVGLVAAPAAAQPFVTYGDPMLGTARRASFSSHVEHASVLFSAETSIAATDWLDAVFGSHRVTPSPPDGRGPWILALLAGVVLLGWVLAPWLPVVSSPAVGGALPWRRQWIVLLLPSLVTPLLLRAVPTHFLPVLVGDYLAAHFAAYGALTMLACTIARRHEPRPVTQPARWIVLGIAALAVAVFAFVGLILPLDRYVTVFMPTAGRLPLMAAMLVGTASFFLADEWANRGPAAGRAAYLASKVAFLVSLAIAVALDFERLFFLIIIVPVILLFFVVHGALSRWSYARTGHPIPAAMANAMVFAWAISVTFPLLAG
jgi:dienelactone hydrolase